VRLSSKYPVHRFEAEQHLTGFFVESAHSNLSGKEEIRADEVVSLRIEAGASCRDPTGLVCDEAVRLVLSRQRDELPPALAPLKRCVGDRLRARNEEICRLRAMGWSHEAIRSKFERRKSRIENVTRLRSPQCSLKCPPN
jgi:hypothetical protein